ncbi:uncharacterized protein L201_001796 [Kwoniella dendrophila CBS 6074]|uniref:F-box domain-containing protein n=1 Tax=Kwoniella dendrophila CBS 6074 TaxID=1295534 RepID=A0AAX4JNC9_9TREE
MSFCCYTAPLKSNVQSPSNITTASSNPKKIAFSPTPRLPNEVLQRIISYVSAIHHPTLAACCRVSKDLNSMAEPLLWRWFTLTPPPLEIDDSEQNNDESFLTTSIWTKETLKMVQILDLKTHPEEWCDPYQERSLVLPNLRTLRLTIESISYVGYEARFHYSILTPRNLEDELSCHFAKYSSMPKTVVSRQGPSIGIDSDHILPAIWKYVETMIFVVPPAYSVSLERRLSLNLSASLPKLKRICIVYNPTGISAQSPAATCGRHIEDQQIITKLIIYNPNCKFTIINSGFTNIRFPSRYRPTIQEAQDSYAETFDKALADHLEELQNNSRSNAENHLKYLNAASFLTLDEFIEREDWYDWFQVAELDQWKRIVDEVDSHIKNRKKQNVE